jgi:hypothetical protein
MPPRPSALCRILTGYFAAWVQCKSENRNLATTARGPETAELRAGALSEDRLAGLQEAHLTRARQSVGRYGRGTLARLAGLQEAHLTRARQSVGRYGRGTLASPPAAALAIPVGVP